MSSLLMADGRAATRDEAASACRLPAARKLLKTVLRSIDMVQWSRYWSMVGDEDG